MYDNILMTMYKQHLAKMKIYT